MAFNNRYSETSDLQIKHTYTSVYYNYDLSIKDPSE